MKVKRPGHFNTVTRALVVSLGLHASALVIVALEARTHVPAQIDRAVDGQRPFLLLPGALAEEQTFVDLLPVFTDPVEADLLLAVPTPRVALAAADEAMRDAQPSAPARGAAYAAGTPAPDTGAALGRLLPTAFRRDRSNLRERLSDGAETYQPSHERTGGRASSPQPIRQEPVVGQRDSSRTRRPRLPVESAPRTSESTEESDRTPPQLAVRLDEVHPAEPGHANARGDGPLDADKGQRRFDVDHQGITRDDTNSRAASNENHPGRLDLSAAAVWGPKQSSEGQGPSATAGATSRPTEGQAPTARGTDLPVAYGARLTMSAAEREYRRYLHHIERRVAAALRWPKRLAILLEQGETVVQFVVRADGRLDGAVRVVKSAGFEEFDTEAVDAVTRAAPFPAPHRTVLVSMPIAFDNPVILSDR